mmetsp:Transcript_3657/g.7573  ORF Transcript_3657/g.7573 Transcript_3657/m.7573 type:complete len:247 (+) Transcript_3657:191-931(+)
MAQYGKKDYWDERYKSDEEHFEWYQRFSGIEHIISKYIKRSDRILVAGCGNSRMSRALYDDGYENITNIDFSEVVINQMSLFEPKLHWEVMDVKDLAYEDGSFDVVIAKGTLDAVLCAGLQDGKRMIEEVDRVLSDGGIFVPISFGLPEKRMELFDPGSLGWQTKVHSVAKPSIENNTVDSKGGFHYVYVCKKGGKEDDDDIVKKECSDDIVKKEECSFSDDQLSKSTLIKKKTKTENPPHDEAPA